MAKIIGHDGSDLAAAAASLQAGRLVAFPTETVYGLGANALDAAASSRIFEVKGRPASDPLIVHVLGWEGAQQLIGDVTPAQRELARAVTDKLWPGPLTVVLPAADAVPGLITAQTGWVGIRSPDHAVARKLIEASGLCLAAPSANRFNHVSPTQPQHVMLDLGARDDSLLVLDGGASNIGIESTVVKVHPDRLEVLRRGAISPSDLASALAGHATLASTPITERDTMSRPKAVVEEMEGPGQMLTHYAPNIPAYLLGSFTEGAASVVGGGEGAAQYALRDVVVIDYEGRARPLAQACLAYDDLSAGGDVDAAAARLFELLRWSETVEGAKAVLIPNLSDVRSDGSHRADLLRAVQDRLFRAASGTEAAVR
eukprot:Rhum_TRINITY_DN14506_c22_g1::Rhum_TRINITY_DN14506_c22_g1_i1::g.95518::m.95518